MTNEEIAKDLTVALVGKMTDPTPDKVSGAYQAIFQKLGEGEQVISLESLEEHLKKIENDAIEASFMHPMALAGAIILGGAIASFPGFTVGPGIVALGVVYFIYILFKYWKFKGKIKS